VSVTLDLSAMRDFRSWGDGLDWVGHLAGLGDGAVIEDGVRIFHPHNVHIGRSCYVGHLSLLNGYHNGRLVIGDGTWVGAYCLLHGAAGLEIGRAVGIGPRVTILTTSHDLTQIDVPPLHGALELGPVRIADGAHLGAGATVLPGVTIGEGAVIGAGALVTGDIPPRSVAVGCPARTIKQR
jgi:acetyltransferase-like isoleucine patch superfamily enzyme